MGDVTEEQEPPEQPIVAMRDLSAPAVPVGGPVGGEVPAQAPFDLPLPDSRQWLVSALLLLLSAVSIVAALMLPLYSIVSQPTFAERNGDGGLLSDVTLQITPWGLARPPGYDGGDFSVLQIVIGPAPRWGIPLVVIAALLVLAGGAYVWRRQAPWAMAAMVGSVALFTGCLVAMATYLLAATQSFQILGAGISGLLGPSFWVLILGLVLAISGALVGWRNQSTRLEQPVERVEPDTPALGFPLPDLDQGTAGS